VTAVVTAPDVAVKPRPARKARRRLRWQRAVSPIVILALWEALSRAGALSPEKLPAPSTVLATGWRLTAEGTLGAHLLDSLTRAGIGLVIGGVLALVLGATAGLLRLGDDAIDPPVQMARMLPHLALVPLLIIWVGIGESMKITLVALGVFFPLYFNTYAGIRDIDERLVEAARTWPTRSPGRRSGSPSAACSPWSSAPPPGCCDWATTRSTRRCRWPGCCRTSHSYRC